MGSVITTDFFTLCWKSARASASVRLRAALTVLGLLSVAVWLMGTSASIMAQTSSPGVEITALDLHRTGESVEVSASLRLDLPATVQEALLKGVPLIFVTEAEIYRERWYWLDKRVGRAQRQLRLLYQPLTRRWRLSPGSEENSAGLAQTFDTLDEALGVIRRVSGWKVADMSELEAGTRHRLEFRFRLDTTQLPRPLQIGALGETDWALAVSTTRRLQPETLK
jgi:hypothetical protein